MSSTVGVGSIFWFELGVVPVTREEASGLAAKAVAEETLPRCRILLVEDNKVNQIVATRFLARLGQTWRSPTTVPKRYRFRGIRPST